ncbi:hypothetical protein AB4302_08355 [Vibrio breoganii]
MFRMFFGMPLKRKKSKKVYVIQPKMLNPDTIQMDSASFRDSDVVKRQLKAAKRAVR